jgi:serine/threonine-protein kinase RsbT
MQDGYSTAHTLGAGLPGVERLMDEFHIETVGVGTFVRAIKWVTPPTRTRIYER